VKKETIPRGSMGWCGEQRHLLSDPLKCCRLRSPHGSIANVHGQKEPAEQETLIATNSYPSCHFVQG